MKSDHGHSSVPRRSFYLTKLPLTYTKERTYFGRPFNSIQFDPNPVKHPGPYHHLRDPIPERTEWMKPQILIPESHGLMGSHDGSYHRHCGFLGGWPELAWGEFHPLATSAQLFSQHLGPLGPLRSPLPQLNHWQNMLHGSKKKWLQLLQPEISSAAGKNMCYRVLICHVMTIAGYWEK